MPALEADTPAIKAELEAIIADGADFQPYIEDDPDRPRREFHGLHGDPSWTALYLWRRAERSTECGPLPADHGRAREGADDPDQRRRPRRCCFRG